VATEVVIQTTVCRAVPQANAQRVILVLSLLTEPVKHVQAIVMRAVLQVCAQRVALGINLTKVSVMTPAQSLLMLWEQLAKVFFPFALN